MAVGGMNQTQATRLMDQFVDAIAVDAAGKEKNDKSRVVMSGNKQLGPVKAFFSGKATRQATIDKFQQALTAKYGQQIGDLATARLDKLRSSGKALTVGTIRTILNESNTFKANLQRLNGPLAQNYMSTPKFATELGRAFERSGLQDNQRDSFATTIKNSVANLAQNSSNKMITPQAIREHVTSITRFAAELEGTFERTGLPANQKSNFALVMENSVASSDNYGDENMHEHMGNVSNYCQKAYTAIKNNSDTLDSYFNLTGRIPDRNKADMAMLMATCAAEGNENQVSMALILEKLDGMRAAQPSGALSPETIWQACMPNKEMPADFGQPLSHLGRQLENAIFDDVESKGATVNAIRGMSVGLKYDAAIELEKNFGAITMDSCHTLPPLGFGTVENPTVDTAEVGLGMDLQRMGNEDGGIHSNFTFHNPAGTKTIDVNNTDHMQGEDLAAYKSGVKSSMTADIKNQVTQMCGNGKQAVAVMYGLTQAGLGIVVNLSRFTGVTKSEHAAMNIDVAKQENGDIRMTYTRPEGQNLVGGYQYNVHQDGSSTLKALDLRADPPVVNPNNMNFDDMDFGDMEVINSADYL